MREEESVSEARERVDGIRENVWRERDRKIIWFYETLENKRETWNLLSP